MTRKHFNAIAEKLHSIQPNRSAIWSDTEYAHRWVEWKITVQAMADVCSRFNPGFKRERFLIACGYHD